MSEQALEGGTPAVEAEVATTAGEPAAEPTGGGAATVVGTVDESGAPDLSDAALEAAARASVEGSESTETPAAEPPPPGPGTDTPEAPAAAAKPPTAEEAEAARIQALIDKQVEGHREREATRAQNAQLAARLAELEAREAAREKALREDPLSVLAPVGHDLETLTRMQLGEKNPAVLAQRQLMARLEGIERALTSEREQRAAAEAEARNASSVASYKATNITAPLAASRGDFPWLFAEHGDAGAVEAVYGEMNRLYQESGGRGQVPAATVVARELEQRIRQRHTDIARKAAEAQSTAKVTPSSKTPKPKTITNGLNQSRPPSEDDGDLSDEALERKARASVAALGN